MNHNTIDQVKSYTVKHQGSNHNFFIYLTEKGYYDGVLIYYFENKHRTNHFTQPMYLFGKENFPNISEEAVYQNILDKLKSLFNDNFQVIPHESNRFVNLSKN